MRTTPTPTPTPTPTRIHLTVTRTGWSEGWTDAPVGYYPAGEATAEAWVWEAGSPPDDPEHEAADRRVRGLDPR